MLDLSYPRISKALLNPPCIQHSVSRGSLILPAKSRLPLDRNLDSNLVQHDGSHRLSLSLAEILKFNTELLVNRTEYFEIAVWTAFVSW